MPEQHTKRPKISRGEIERLRSIGRGGNGDEKIEAGPKQAEVAKDLWTDGDKTEQDDENGEKDNEDSEKKSTFSFLEEKKPIRAPSTLKHSPLSQLANGKPTPSVRKPDAGRSYNPAFEDWDALITKAGTTETEAERRRLHAAAIEAERVERVRQSAVEAEAAEKREEARGSGDEDGSESEWEGIISVDEADLAKKRPERKTKAQRNKIKRRKEAERLEQREMAQKRKEKEVARVKVLVKEVNERERAREAREKGQVANNGGASSDSDEAEDVVLRQRRFGKAM